MYRMDLIQKNSVEGILENVVISIVIGNLALGQLRLSHALKKQSCNITPGRQKGIWLGRGLHIFKHRLKALESKSTQEGIVLTETQITALERAKEEKWTGDKPNIGVI